MKKPKKIIHKIKWQKVTVEGWYIHPIQLSEKEGGRSLCSNIYVTLYHKFGKWHIGNGSIKWKKVTCKKCLKMRK